MEIVKTYKGAGNTATIEKHKNRPAYQGDKIRATLYRVVFTANHDHDFIYHVVCFETLSEAEKHISEYPFFKEV